MRGTVAIVTWALVSWLVSPASAQEAVTLEDAITRAIAYSARLAELGARQAGAAAVEDAGDAARWPVVAAQAGYTRTNHVTPFVLALPLRVLYPDVPDNYRARLDLQWPIYTGGRTEALTAAARAETAAVAEDIAAARADLKLEVTRAFWALVTARETEVVVSRAVDRMDAHVGDLKTRLEQGLISPNDLTSAEAQRSRDRLLAIEARNVRMVSEADLRRLIGGSGPLVPTGATSGPGQGQVGVAPSPRPERRALDRRLEASEAREDSVEGFDKPQISAIAGYDYAKPNPKIFPRADRWDDSWDISLNVSWTLWDSGRRKAEQAEAAAATRALQARITEFDRQAAFEVQQRELELESARAAIDTAADGIRSAAETRRVLAERYRQGVATSTEVLDAEVALLQAELDRTRALASARLAEARLERARGQ